MLGSKIFASSLLLSTSFFSFKDQKTIKAECAEQTGAEKGVQDLDQIFAQADGGMPPDPEEIQEMLMKAQGKTIR